MHLALIHGTLVFATQTRKWHWPLPKAYLTSISSQRFVWLPELSTESVLKFENIKLQIIEYKPAWYVRRDKISHLLKKLTAFTANIPTKTKNGGAKVGIVLTTLPNTGSPNLFSSRYF